MIHRDAGMTGIYCLSGFPKIGAILLPKAEQEWVKNLKPLIVVM
jgi:hypothetical protein